MNLIGTIAQLLARTALAVMVTVALGQAAFAAPVRVVDRDGYGRIVFDWPAPVRYAANVIGGQLVLQFDRPVTGNIGLAASSLPGYLRDGRISPDRLTVTFPLTNTFQMRAITVGTAVVVDLFGAQPLRQAAAQPATVPPTPSVISLPTQAPTLAPSAVTVRNGRHPDYARVVFDWPTAVPYRVQRQGDRVTIVFERPSTLSVDALRRGLPVELRSATLSTTGNETIVSLPAPADQELRHFVNGNSIVVDLLSSGAVIAAQPNNTDVPSTEPPAQVAQTATEQAAPATLTQAIRPSGAIPVALLGELSIPIPPPGKPQVPDVASGPGARAVAPPVVASVSSAPTMQSAGLAEDMAPAGAGARDVSLVIPWTEPAAAAIFRRAGFLWAIFDRYQQVDVDALARVGAPYVTYVEQLPYRNNTILRMVTQPGLNPFVRREGLAWIIDFRAMPMRPTRAIETRPQFDRTDPNLFLPITEAGRTVAVEDPEVGDMFLAVPVIPLGYGIFPDRSYPDFDMPSTAQGVVVVPKSDGVRAQASRIGIDVDVDGGMAVSSQALVGGDVIIPFESAEQLQRILNLGDWQIGNEADFNRNKQALQFALGDEREEVREEARYRLARYQFVNGFFPETLAILRIMQDNAADIEDAGSFRALRGATNLMMRRYEDAIEDFNHYSLSNEDDARFWMAIAKAQIADPSLEAETIIKTGSVIETYPRRIKIPLAIMAAEATIDAGDDFGAQGFLDMIRRETPRPNELAAIAYLDGKLNTKIGELQLALEQYKIAEESQSRYYQTLAARERNELERQLGNITTAELIENLESLRYRWRGDEIELSILHRLADLYIDQDNYGDALRTLKLAASYFRDDPGVEQVALRMNVVFEELFINGAADDLSPITAIALFDEFSDLLPPGRRGDEMIRKLADRLVSVDLLEQAALLLERQVEFRLAGPDQARVGGRLALVHLLNRQPDKALQVLQDTASGQLTRELQASRRRLQARALTELNRSDEAIVLLGADMSPESKQLRAEIYWRSQNWPAAANAIAEMVPAADRNLALDDAQARLVLDWATALTLAGDDRTATRVRQRYLAAMERTPFADAFDLITTPRERGLVDYRTVRSQIEQAEDFQSFLVEYEEMIGEETLSSAIN
ncbi:MAG: tetratricopeptide repeat protein [Alphaproteobacteria bacterium]|nr:tetratricopeptide repeat protein [Alphaproteobacteria bacterium]